MTKTKSCGFIQDKNVNVNSKTQKQKRLEFSWYFFFRKDLMKNPKVVTIRDIRMDELQLEIWYKLNVQN